MKKLLASTIALLALACGTAQATSQAVFNWHGIHCQTDAKSESVLCYRPVGPGNSYIVAISKYGVSVAAPNGKIVFQRTQP